MNYYTLAFKKYAEFKGRSTRSEYWYFVLFNIIVSMVLGLIEGIMGLGEDNLDVLSGLYSLVVLVPSLAIGVRRLHDTNRTGWWLFLVLVPIVGWIALLVFFVQDSTSGDNLYGPNPKGMMPVQPAQTV